MIWQFRDLRIAGLHAFSNRFKQSRAVRSCPIISNYTRSQLARNERRRIVKQRAEALLIESRQMNFTFERTIEILRQCEAALRKETTKEHADER